MPKFKKDDIVMYHGTKSEGDFPRGTILVITDDEYGDTPKVNKQAKWNCIHDDDADLLSEIPLNKICVNTRTQEEWNCVCRCIGTDVNNWNSETSGKWLADPFGNNNVNSCTLDCLDGHPENDFDGYTISFFDFLEYIVPMHFFTVKDKPFDDFPDPEGLPLDLLSIQ